MPPIRRTFTDRPSLTGARDRIGVKTYVVATDPATPWFAAMGETLRHSSGWRIRDLPCGHAIMLEMPEETVQLLMEAAGG